jgi:uncharacterized protein YlxP (DUF503 family)
MFFAVCRFEIHIPQSRSLKAKRSVVGGLKERLRARFHAAVAEVDHQDLRQRAALGVALAGHRPGTLEEALAAMRRLVEQETRCVVTLWQTRVEPFEGAARAPHAAENVAEESPAWDQVEGDDELYGPGWQRE